MLRDEGREIHGGRRYAANVTWLLVAEIAAKVASLVFVVIVARSVGTRDFGYFSFALSFVPLFLVLGRSGIESGVVRELARDRARLSELVSTGLVLRVSLGLVGFAAALAIGPLVLPAGRPYLVLVLVAVALFLDELSSFVAAVFLAFERMRFRAATVLVNRLLSAGLAGLAVAFDGGLLAVCGAYLIGSAVAVVLDFALLHRYFPPVDYGAVRRSVGDALLRTAVPLGIASILNAAVFRLDSVLLQTIRGPVEVARYNVAYRFFESLLFVAWTLGTLALPRISRAVDQREAAREYGLAASLALAFYLPLAVMLPFAAEWLVRTVFSSRYEDAASAVGILAGAGVLYAFAYVGRMALIALRRTRAVVLVAVVALVVNLGLNIYLIPAHGFKGAAWSMLAAEIVEGVLLTGLFLRANHVLPNLRPFVVPSLAAAGLAAALGLSGWRGPNALAFSLVAYPAALVLVALLVAPAEVRQLRALLGRDRGVG